MAIACAALAGRLAQVQLLGGQRYVAYGQSQMDQYVNIQSSRGSIVDRRGNILAMSVPQSDVYADPRLVSDPAGEAAILSPILGLPASLLQQRLSQPHVAFVYLERQVNDSVANKIKALMPRLAGLGLLPSSRRFAPNGNLAVPVLGFTGMDGGGLGGLEYQFNSVLSGTPGVARISAGPLGVPVPGGVKVVRKSAPGGTVVLTLDTAIQYQTEQALAKEIVASKARGGMAVIEDSRTGQILAMASLSRTALGPPQPTGSNWPLTYTYEPGSVMKVATFSGALSAGIITPSTPLAVPAQLLIDHSVFHDAEPHGNEVLTATQILAQSSNIGTIEIAQRLGAPAVFGWIKAFGFGVPTGLNFPGESSGLIRPLSTWSPTAIGSTPIGQDTGVTAVQVLDAYNVVANGGIFVPPRLEKRITNQQGVTIASPSGQRHRVLTTTVASTMVQMLEHVATPQGTAPQAKIPGYVVAGKTGTAQIANTNGRGYQPGAFMATFVGFVPAQKPALTAIVVLDRPTPIYGGLVAAPVFSQICAYALRLLNVPPPTLSLSQAPSPGG